MSASELPMMPFWIKDWIAATQHWSDAERGAYISLLAHQWANGTVPPETQRLARIMGTSEAEFDARWGVVGPKFDGDVEGLFNKRLEEHREKALGLRAAKIRGANGANAVRAARKAERVASANAERPDVRDAPRTHPSPSPSPSSKNSETDTADDESERSANAERVPRGTVNYWNEEKWIDYKLRMPNRAGGNTDKPAREAWRARLREGHTWEQLLDGADRYNAYCAAEGNIGTRYVMQRKTFCGPSKPFLESWDLPQVGTPGATWRPPSDDAPEAA